MMKNMTPRAETENLKVMTPKFLGKTSINLMTQYPVIHKKNVWALRSLLGA
jgi:hypothetical protein